MFDVSDIILSTVLVPFAYIDLVLLTLFRPGSLIRT